jgi:MFS family permease
MARLYNDDAIIQARI